MKRLSIIGSTGSIGKNTLKIASHLKEEFEVVALAAKSNIDLLEEQIKEFRPKLVAVYDETKAIELKRRGVAVEVLASMEGLTAVAEIEGADLVVSATNGSIGLIPTLAAIRKGRQVALATKEVLVSAGSMVMEEAKRYGAKIIPIDSELTALFQCLNGERREDVARLILTASGGPFRNLSEAELRSVSLKAALNHPNYDMGTKVTIDSSTLMNKGLELLEASALFEMPVDKIDVVVHPEQVVHSMIEFVDQSIMAQMGEPNMLPPIQYALTYPTRRRGLLKKFNFTKALSLQFYPPDTERFRCLRLAYEAGREGGSLPCFMNAANEVLVQRFANERISWPAIGEKLEKLMLNHPIEKMSSFDTILAIESEARELAAEA